MSEENPVEFKEKTYEKRSAANIVLIALVVLSIGLSSYSLYLNNRVGVYDSQLSTLTSSLNSLNLQLSESNSRIAELNARLSDVESNGTGGGRNFIQLYESVKGSVVLIKAVIPQGVSQGSGFVYDLEGLIITNNHVVEGATTITVTFIDGTILKASLVGRDPFADIAVIIVEATPGLLKPLRLGDSSALKVGETVLALGNPYGLADTLTSGIVSALGREMESAGGFPIVDVIQTDAPINPGNSGGPLLNLVGEVIGINTAIPSETSTGIGFAVPSATILRELPELILKGTYGQAYIGLQGTDLTPSINVVVGLPQTTRGTLVFSVTPGAPAEKGGLRGGTQTATVDGERIAIGGDVIIGADGKPMLSYYDLILYIQRNKRPGDLMSLTIIRSGAQMTLNFTLETRQLS